MTDNPIDREVEHEGRMVRIPPDMPKAMQYNLPKTRAGLPIPFFVEYIDGKPDFRVMSSTNMERAMRSNLCWVCGRKLTRSTGTFVVGPMCVVNQVSAEPPSHFPCAKWSTQACPFLNQPLKTRRETHLPDGYVEPSGIMIARNPGVSALVTTHEWDVFEPDPRQKGVLWRFKIEQVVWMARGREATAEEVWESVETGVDALIEVADQQAGARLALASEMTTAIKRWLPERPAGDYPRIDAALGAT